MTKEQPFEITHYTNLASRRNYSKIKDEFVGNDLLEIQKQTYKDFLNKGLGKIFESFFPITHPKNTKFTLMYYGYKIEQPLTSEEQCRERAETYEQPLYVKLKIINNETGEIKVDKKSEKHEGVYFASIPTMTDKGTFIINGTEKIVVNQILRSPGAYFSPQSNEKKDCEILPSNGPRINFWIDTTSKDEIIKIKIVRPPNWNQGHIDKPISHYERKKDFLVTTVLKAFGMVQDEIRKIYNDDVTIIQTLFHDSPYTHHEILDDPEIVAIRKTIKDFSEANSEKIFAKGSNLEKKLKRTVIEYLKIDNEYTVMRSKYQNIYNIEEKEGELTKKSNKEVVKLLDNLHEIEQKRKTLLDIIITEKAAKDLIADIGIPTKYYENNYVPIKNEISFQDVIVGFFMNWKNYDLSSAGRYKLQYKLRVSERLYGRTIAQDVIKNNGEVIIKKNTLILNNELNILKELLSTNQLKNHIKTIKIHNKQKIIDGENKQVEVFEVYEDNNLCENTIPIIGLPWAKENSKINIFESKDALTITDFISVVSYILGLPKGIGSYDDIDHIGNKRLRLIYEQLRSKIIIGLRRMEKYIADKLGYTIIGTTNPEQRAKLEKKITPLNVTNATQFTQTIKEFFNTYKLTQFADQQNPLSELANKRRISAMGDGGISREDPNLDVRDVHYSHYSRICPIESPEGANIGLIMSLANFTKVDVNGFLLAPYYKVKEGVVTKEIEWLSPFREDERIISPTTSTDEHGSIKEKQIICRYRSNQQLFNRNQIEYMEISPKQVVSLGSSLIPFLENDDTSRALMGTNMQRQAVPLIKPYAPCVGTGSENKVAQISGLAANATSDGVIHYVDGNKIVVKTNDNKLETHKLIKYRRSNQETCINQTPIVHEGQHVKTNDIIADGPAMDNGELALGRNPLIAFTTWSGYNYEDAIVVSERLIKEDVYTSITINEHIVECISIDKIGDEEITRDIPNVGEENKRYLDEDGVIMVGAEVFEGDILIGKTTPKIQTDVTPEEKLLQAIFGSKSKTVRDTSLKVPRGGEGIVISVKHFSIQKGDKLGDGVLEKYKVSIAQKRKIQIGDKMAGRHGNKGIVSIVVPVADMPHLEDGTPIDICLNPLGVPSRMNLGQIMEVHLGMTLRQNAKQQLIKFVLQNTSISEVSKTFGIHEAKTKSLLKIAKTYFDDLGINSLEKANKNIKDIDLAIILNNAGMSFEDLNLKAATPVFCGANLENINQSFDECGIDVIKTKGKFKLIDGRSGEYLDNPVTVGIMYMMKLDHMVDDKIHARCVGPYSKITQQPLGGRGQNGGQRFGEMEVWALEAYGAAYNLREMLTIKSDDIRGRNLTYSAIVHGKPLPQPSLPESFKLLTKQLQGLGIGLNVTTEDGQEDDINNYTAVISDVEVKETLNNDVVQSTIEQSSYQEDNQI